MLYLVHESSRDVTEFISARLAFFSLLGLNQQAWTRIFSPVPFHLSLRAFECLVVIIEFPSLSNFLAETFAGTSRVPFSDGQSRRGALRHAEFLFRIYLRGL